MKTKNKEKYTNEPLRISRERSREIKKNLKSAFDEFKPLQAKKKALSDKVDSFQAQMTKLEKKLVPGFKNKNRIEDEIE